MDRVALVSPATTAEEKSTISTTSSSFLFRSSKRLKKKTLPSHYHQQPLLSPSSCSSSTGAMPRSTKSLKHHTTSQARGTTRVARLASLFSSRALVAEPKQTSLSEPKMMSSTRRLEQGSAVPPPSPSKESDASSSYVAWPGTQDKRGSTTVLPIQSSYDDSSDGGGAYRVNLEEELEQEQNVLVEKWMHGSSTVKKLTPLERRIVHGPPPEEEEETSDSENPADFHLAAVLNAAAASNSPLRPKKETYTRALSEANSRFLPDTTRARSVSGKSAVSSSAISIQDLFLEKKAIQNLKTDPWDVDSSSSHPSTSVSKDSTSVSKDSSLYKVSIPGIDDDLTSVVMQNEKTKIRPPTAEALARISPPHRTLNAMHGRGYRGFIDKTRDVPNLMDAVDSDASSRATSTYSRYSRSTFSESYKRSNNKMEQSSDVFDGVAENHVMGALPRQHDSDDQLNVVVLPSGLASIQSPQEDYDNRQTSTEFDETLTNSEVDQYGFIKLPDFEGLSSTFVTAEDSSPDSSNPHDVIPARLLDSTESETSDSSDSIFYPLQRHENDLSRYYIEPRLVKKLVRKYRKMSAPEDAKKAFALFEMRSRIMEKDIDRGLERRGGTVCVDDLVLTNYHQAALRVRDAVIVSKAWRDGASPRDVITASLLKTDLCYCVERPEYYEVVRWMDDTDFMQLRCPSLGPRCMRGFEMFTIGDCQSILLKLTNERCMQLRAELNDATARQIEAEEIMRDEESETGMDHGMMTEAEMTYLTSMEEVKALSKQLVLAERAFHLVRDRIEQLVAKYETLLVRIENESVAASSVITFESSYYSDGYDSSHYDTEEDREKEQLARRAQRAEIKAELAAREAVLAKQEAKKSVEEKQRELEELQLRLLELQSEHSHVIFEREHSVILAKAIAANSGRSPALDAQSAIERAQQQSGDYQQEKIDVVKQKFRDRMAERKRGSKEPPQRRNSVLSGEEMYQYLDFYERSLKAVENQRVGVR